MLGWLPQSSYPAALTSLAGAEFLLSSSVALALLRCVRFLRREGTAQHCAWAVQDERQAVASSIAPAVTRAGRGNKDCHGHTADQSGAL